MSSTLLVGLLVFIGILVNNSQINCEQSNSASSINDETKKCFRAAVYEHIAISQPIDEPLQRLNNNFQIYERVIKRASFFDTKIIVLPEYSFFSSLPSKRDELLSKGVSPIAPDLNVNLCSIYKAKLKNITQSTQSDIEKSEQLQQLNKETLAISDKILVNKAILRKLSCLAAENKIYIAVNLVTIENAKSLINKKSSNIEDNASSSSSSSEEPSELDSLKESDKLINEKLTDQLNKIASETSVTKYEDYLLYNTELVFDAQGKLVAKYHKYNLYGESAINRTNSAELVTFNSAFGKFGIAICADILFEQPIKQLVEKEKIDHLIYSSEWFSELPSLTSFNVHAAAAIKYQINILSASKRNFLTGEFGSAIYNGKLGVRVQTAFDNHDRLLIADLPIGSLNNANDDSTVSANEKVDIETMEYSSIDTLPDTSSLLAGKIDVNELDKGQCSHFEPVRVAEETYQEFSYVFKDNTFLSSYRPLQTPFDLFKVKRLENTEGQMSELCDKTVCCEIEWKMNDKFNFVSDNYFLAAISRLKQSTDLKVAWYEENCALISKHQYKPEYKLVASTHFDKLVLRGKFNSTQIFPTVLSSALYLVPKHKWNFKQIYNEAELSFENIKRPITFASLYARVYEKDQMIRD